MDRNDAGSIDRELVDLVKHNIAKGNRILIGRNYLGQSKIKIKVSPFGLISRRYTANPVTLEAIRQEIQLLRQLSRTGRLSSQIN